MSLQTTTVEGLLGEPEINNWLVPELLERGDRVIFTGREGKGKSTLLRQIGYRLSVGLHPFVERPIQPCKVAYIDLENSRAQVRRALRRLYLTAGVISPMHLILEPAGLNLLTRASECLPVLDAIQPDVIIAGPMYKLAYDLRDEEASARIAAVIDAWRQRYSCCVLLESHQPHETSDGEGRYRPERPFGSSLWMRWPEFGFCLEDSGLLRPWRGPREERDWPLKLKRGEPDKWPWMADSLHCLNCGTELPGTDKFCSLECSLAYSERKKKKG